MTTRLVIGRSGLAKNPTSTSCFLETVSLWIVAVLWRTLSFSLALWATASSRCRLSVQHRAIHSCEQYTHIVSTILLVLGQDKGGLREVHLICDLLHVGSGDRPIIIAHGELVARVLLGEYVHDVEIGHTSLLRQGPGPHSVQDQPRALEPGDGCD